MKIELMQTSQLIEYANNPRRNDGAVDAVMASIKEFGFRQPIVCDEQLVVLVGHTRLKAARKLGLATVPVHIAVGLSEAQQRAYRIADNRTGETAEWDEELLAIELEELRMADFDLGTLGFDEGEVDALLAALDANEGETDPDAVPEAPVEPVGGKVSLSDRFMVPPFSVLNAREGWWQDRKRAWISLGIRSEEGRGGGDMTEPSASFKNQQKLWGYSAAPGGSARPACDYSDKSRGDGAGRKIK